MSNELDLPIVPEGYRWNVRKEREGINMTYYSVSLQKTHLMLGLFLVWKTVGSMTEHIYTSKILKRSRYGFTTVVELVNKTARLVHEEYFNNQETPEEAVTGIHYTQYKDSTDV